MKWTKPDGTAVTENDVRQEAKRLKYRTKNNLRFAAFKEAGLVTIRWDVPNQMQSVEFRESYACITVECELLDQIVTDHFAPLIE
ncbi:MAG: hypothetical protein AAF092_10590 [Pseudomonadota bacterium]